MKVYCLDPFILFLTLFSVFVGLLQLQGHCRINTSFLPTAGAIYVGALHLKTKLEITFTNRMITTEWANANVLLWFIISFCSVICAKTSHF